MLILAAESRSNREVSYYDTCGNSDVDLSTEFLSIWDLDKFLKFVVRVHKSESFRVHIG